MVIKRIYMAGAFVAVALASGCSKAPTVSFASDVMPVLDRHCNECHKDIDPEKLESAISEALPDTLKAKRKDGNIVTISI